jgi:hypothetical protein
MQKEFPLLQDAFTLEKSLIELKLNFNNIQNEESRFDIFCKVQQFLSTTPKPAILEQKFQLIGNIRIVTLKYPIAEIKDLQEEDIEAFINKINQRQEGEYVCLLKKEINGSISSTYLAGIHQLLYYFGEAISGSNLIEIIAGDMDMDEDEIKSLEEKVFNFITETLVYDRYLQINESEC